MPDIPMGALLPFVWGEEQSGAQIGEGISRPKAGAKTKKFHLLITLPSCRPMLWITRAESKTHAINYAKARWPQCSVEVA